MSSDQPPGPGSGPGEPPENDPFRKKPPEPEPPAGPPQGSGPPPGSEEPRASGPPPGGIPYSQSPYADNPYGGEYGAADPLAGMPPLANRGRRLVARIIDAIIIGVPVGVIMNLIVGWANYTSTSSIETSKQATVSGVTMLVYLVYEGLMLTSRGQTVGKMAMKIRVAMLANGAVPAGQAGWIRAAVYTLPEIVPCCGFVFWLVNVLWCTWDKPYQQCLHDKAAKTVVVSAA
ncbi:RDD family protein [Streptomyces chattanoogensis]|uniref:RDD domain-containing protein n=1 Tax=Streptomyces chattanoogensis TaxID=66876 RepID=A0A0N0XXF3_9ACTN|nr:RDD family protein [Streptomyces chattanoogensis]KPC64854.1 RDD domain-containing protein [Streptomyces chattanoogensis]